MILDGILYSIIYFGRVILYVWNSPVLFSLLSLFYGFFRSNLFVYCRPLCFPFNVVLLIQYALYTIFSQDSDLPSGEGVSTH